MKIVVEPNGRKDTLTLDVGANLIKAEEQQAQDQLSRRSNNLK